MDNSRRDLLNSSYHTKSEFNNCFNINSDISKFLTTLPPRSLSSKYLPLPQHSFRIWPDVFPCRYSSKSRLHPSSNTFYVFLHFPVQIKFVKPFSSFKISTFRIISIFFIYLFLLKVSLISFYEYCFLNKGLLALLYMYWDLLQNEYVK